MATSHEAALLQLRLWQGCQKCCALGAQHPLLGSILKLQGRVLSLQLADVLHAELIEVPSLVRLRPGLAPPKRVSATACSVSGAAGSAGGAGAATTSGLGCWSEGCVGGEAAEADKEAKVSSTLQTSICSTLNQKLKN